ncbi:hypothetical protein [Roseovarius sp. 217]|uniref:hypothetical protein n=1 Tax=Roseovarius sp. (strain 217) TaxID=314264 RepID=UPI0000686675|nr:hypothetical protein [Roseovarius sp. 217]EAQ22824.1 hypothetical protein ROS217_18140 [Roseovarius sp. 217]
MKSIPTTEEPNVDDLVAFACRISLLCELATDLVDGIDTSQDYRLPQITALLYTMQGSAVELARKIDRLN